MPTNVGSIGQYKNTSTTTVKPRNKKKKSCTSCNSTRKNIRRSK